MFQANPAGVRTDYLASNDISHGDMGWDPVWELRSSVDSLGWIAEMRIPFSQLRFPDSPEQQWGINFSRYVFRKNELVRWSWAPNTETGYAYLVGADGREACGGGLHMIDINDPLNPQFKGCFRDERGTHDVQCAVYRGPDERYQGHEICLKANGGFLSISELRTGSA